MASPARKRAEVLARQFVANLRDQGSRPNGAVALMHEFALSSDEGVALMCLAEALLRVPDRPTVDRLIRDKLARGNWQAHVGHSPSLFVSAAAWGLLVTGRLLAPRPVSGFSGALTRGLLRGGEPLVRKSMDVAMRMLGEQFVAGRDIREALARGARRAGRGYRHSFDMLGEAALNADDARRYFKAYEHTAHAIGRASLGRGVVDGDGMSVKLSALHPRYGWSQHDRVMGELLPRIKALCALARAYDIGLSIDAEEADRLELSLDVFEALASDAELAGWRGLGFVVQAYQKRAPLVVDWLIDLARRRDGGLAVRLVKGAYWDTEIKRAQLDGLDDYPVYTRKAHTDVCYLACARALLAARPRIYPQFATHNAHTLAAIIAMDEAGSPRPGRFEFQGLHGMGEALFDQLIENPALNKVVRIYAPVGSHDTLLAYLVRRLLENGANNSFIHRVIDANVAEEDLIADPVELVVARGATPHPAIPLPRDIFGSERRGAQGCDFSSAALRHALQAAIEESRRAPHCAAPIRAGAPAASAPAEVVRNPADARDQIGTVCEAGDDDIACAIDAALADGRAWSARSPRERAECLDRTADLLECERGKFVALAVREAGKSWANAVAEVREAVDFCRYYAVCARALDQHVCAPIGPVVCISPWNFPLAIFTGQVAAALVAGNPVLAKPAEQTPLIAAAAVALFHRAGVPRAALQLLPGRGEHVGAALVADVRVRGVLFTGSTAVAASLNRVLAHRDDETLLIAETGGQNAMIVDSTALPEQVVGDVLTSAFDSAGQRCSALRVLCLQDEIAEAVMGMLVGAMRELRIGDPADCRIDIGPVIDAAARNALERHIDAMRARGFRVWQLPLPEACRHGTFVAPAVVEIDGLQSLGAEHFGPVLHVMRYRAKERVALVDAINALGYGLTCGVHSRIDETVRAVVDHVRAGNLYVNRNMMGGGRGAAVRWRRAFGHGSEGRRPVVSTSTPSRRGIRSAVFDPGPGEHLVRSAGRMARPRRPRVA